MDIHSLAASLWINGSVFYAKGINHYNVDCNNNLARKNESLHAEVDAINHLKYTYKKKKVNLLVYRTNKMGDQLLSAVPCKNCYNHIIKELPKKGYKLNKIYYTTNSGTINYI